MSDVSAPTADVVVVGGGAAGLSAASALAHRDVVLLDVTYRVADIEHRLRARRAVVCTPAFDAADIVRTLPRPVVAELATVEYGAFVCVGLLTAELPDLPWDDVYAIVAPGASFDMLFNHSNPFRSPRGSPTRRSLMCYVGGRRARALLDATAAEIEDTLLKDLATVLPEVAGAIEETAVATWRAGNCLPAASTRLDRTQEWNSRPDGRLYLAGDYFAPLGGTIDAATSSGLGSAQMVESGAGRSPDGDRDPGRPSRNGRTER